MTDVGVTGILIAHLGAFSSGELKTCKITHAVLIHLPAFEITPWWFGGLLFTTGNSDLCCFTETCDHHRLGAGVTSP